MDQLKLSELIRKLQDMKDIHGDVEAWFHVCGGPVGKDMPMQVEDVVVVERSWGTKYIVVC